LPAIEHWPEGFGEPTELGIRSWRRSLAAAVNIAFFVTFKMN
jgi:hypothetical protein